MTLSIISRFITFLLLWIVHHHLWFEWSVLVACSLLLVVVKIYYLRQELTCYLIEWCHLIRSDRNLHILEMSDYRLKLRIINSIQWFNHLQVICCCLLLHYRLFHRSEVFLIWQVYMVQKRTLTGQERARYLQRLCVPVFRLFLLQVWLIIRIFLHL